MATFQIVTSHNDLAVIAMLAVYIWVTLLSVFFYCWFGQELWLEVTVCD